MANKVNRFLKDKAMDRIDHAIGRPVDPMAQGYRNHFATDAGSDLAKEFDDSPYWARNTHVAPGDMAFYHVTDEGRAALRRHLREIGDKHRLYEVTYEGQTETVVAVSAAKAKYRLWLSVSDCFQELTFGRFCRAATVRAAA